MNLLTHPTPDPEHWRRIEAVLDLALEAEPHEVAELLDRECPGAPQLRREIEALLEADRQAGGLMAVAAAVMLNPFADDFAPPPARIGRYAVTGTLGRGGMSVVYEGLDETLGRRVALKSLPPSFAQDPIRLERFVCEARLLGAIADPHLTAFHGITRDGTRRYLVLERVQGQTLAERLLTGALGAPEASGIAAQIAQALATMHRFGIVHRDLKPANVMITPLGLVKLLDLGLAEVSAVSSADTTAWARAGTPGYMSPEQIAGAGQDARSDVFAWGVVVWECLTGTAPFAGATAAERIAATLERGLDAALLPADTPAALRATVLAALSRDPAQRPADGDALAGAATANASSPPTLPAPLPAHDPTAIRFVGRERERRELSQLLEHTALVTLTGPGGVGKTRLAHAVATERFSTVWFAELADAHDDPAIEAAIARAAGLRNMTRHALLEALAAAPHACLVLDHCEHIAPELAHLLTLVRAFAPSLRIVLTSREPLGEAGEQVLRVPPLDCPDPEAVTAHDGHAAAAVDLFLLAAQKALPQAVFSSDDMRTIAVICRHADGMPLAIELAAARLRDESLQSIASSWAHGQDEVRTDDAVRENIRWSLERLGAREQRFFRALHVFHGGWDFGSSARTVCPDEDPFEALDCLTALIERSLVTIERVDRNEPRYRFLEPVRQFAAECCDAAGETAALRARHRDTYLAAVETLAPTLVHGAAQARGLAWLEAEQANVLAALEYDEGDMDSAQKALRLAGAMWWFWYVRGHFTRGRAALAAALARAHAGAPTPARALGLFAAGGLAVFQRDYRDGRRLSTEALAIFETLGDERGVARAASHLALCDGGEGRFDDAARLYERAVAIFRRLGDVRRLSATLNNLGVLDRQRNDFAAAYEHHAEAIELFRKADDRDGMVVTLLNLALAATRTHRDTAALTHLREALALVMELRARRAGAAALEVAAEVLCARSGHAAAAECLGAAEALRVSMRLPADDWWRRMTDTLAHTLRTQLGPDVFACHDAAGAERGFSQAITHALHSLSSDVARTAT